jgi:hypothetical protein
MMQIVLVVLQRGGKLIGGDENKGEILAKIDAKGW